MKVIMRDSMGGDFFTYAYGDCVDVQDEKEARRWIENGIAIEAPKTAEAKHTHRATPRSKPVRELATAPAAPERAENVTGGEPFGGLSDGSPPSSAKAEGGSRRVRGASNGRGSASAK